VDRLVEIIGPAPSEMSIDELIRKLTTERDRVRESLDYFQVHGPINPKSKSKAKKASEAKPKGGRKAKPKVPSLVEQAKAKGLSEQQIMLLLAKLGEEKDGQS
jgi:hypothetical protein